MRRSPRLVASPRAGWEPLIADARDRPWDDGCGRGDEWYERSARERTAPDSEVRREVSRGWLRALLVARPERRGARRRRPAAAQPAGLGGPRTERPGRMGRAPARLAVRQRRAGRRVAPAGDGKAVAGGHPRDPHGDRLDRVLPKARRGVPGRLA